MPTTVTLFLKGSLVLFAKKGDTTGKVAILKVPPPRHVLTVKYKVQPPGGVFGPAQAVSPIQDALDIDVVNPASPTITLRKENAQINRLLPPTDQDSFKWFVDFENQELYPNSIGANKSKFKQILTFKGGELFSGAPLSYNKLLVQRGSEAEYETFGFVAGIIGVLFSGDRVVFRNGGSVVFDSGTFDPGTNFRIELENDALPSSVLVTDANHYYKGIGSGIPHDERILFASIVQRDDLRIHFEHQLQVLLHDAQERGDNALANALQNLLPLGPPAGPEAACFPAYVSRTGLQ